MSELQIGYAPVIEYTIETILKVMRALDIKLHPEAVHMDDDPMCQERCRFG